MVFPAVSLHRDSASDSDRYRDAHGSFNLFATVEAYGLRLLGEWYFANYGNEIQRLQIGWQVGADDVVWLGRFHTPIGYWNTEYHHGTYLQTSISRPGVAEFEGHHGPLPTHFTGVLWEGATGTSGRGLHYALGIGAAPRLDERLQALDVAHVEGRHGLGAIANVNWRPAAYDTRQIGAFVGKSRIRDDTTAARHFDQSIVGAYGNWLMHRTRLIGAVYYVWGEFDGAGELAGASEDFTSAYLQAEQPWSASWTTYARIELSAGIDAQAPYLSRFHGVVKRRALAGLRYDFQAPHAVTLELARGETLVHWSSSAALQWSAYFP